MAVPISDTGENIVQVYKFEPVFLFFFTSRHPLEAMAVRQGSS
jgi:hypothetical protein